MGNPLLFFVLSLAFNLLLADQTYSAQTITLNHPCWVKVIICNGRDKALPDLGGFWDGFRFSFKERAVPATSVA